MTLADLLSVPLVEVKEKVLFMEQHCSRCFTSYLSELVKTVVKHRLAEKLDSLDTFFA